jgi:hypothetical protein
MAFGQCDDPWNQTSSALSAKTDPKSFETPMGIDQNLPPATGNCVTGGRTGYSVKLISPELISSGNSQVKIVNPIDPTYFQF